MNPFLNVNALSDEDIIERLGRAYKYLNEQVRLGHTPTVSSIQEIIESLELERATRLQKHVEDETNKKYPDTLKPIDVGGIEVDEK